MDYKELAEKLENLEVIAYRYNINGEVMGMDCSDFEQIMVDAMDAITDLLARAEVAEKERDWLKMCFELAQRKEKEAEARAEKAEIELNVAVSDLETVMAYGNLDTCQLCKNGQCYKRGGTKPCLPEWRGQKEE